MQMRTGPELIQLASELPPKPITFEDMTVAQLRQLLKKHGRPSSGMNKAELIANCYKSEYETDNLSEIYEAEPSQT